MSALHLQISLLLLSLFAAPLQAAERPFLDEPDNTLREDILEREWQEGEVVLPDGYQEPDLQEFQLEPPDRRLRYFIDRRSLLTAEDGVTRFLLVIRSDSGATNLSYEGLRCGHRQYKVYAYGGKDGLKRLPGALWQVLPRSGGDAYRRSLYQDLLCNLNTGLANPPKDVFRAMRRGKRVNNFFFTQD